MIVHLAKESLTKKSTPEVHIIFPIERVVINRYVLP